MKINKKVVFVCNYVDEITRATRSIDTDSPAASRKVIQMCKALRLAGVQPYILSLGRGRAGGGKKFFEEISGEFEGISITYCSFSHRRVWSELRSLFSLFFALRKLNRQGFNTVIFYNQLPLYLGALLYARVKGLRIFVDLEDGWFPGEKSVRDLFFQHTVLLFERVKPKGVILACSALAATTNVSSTHCYYGNTIGDRSGRNWSSNKVKVLLSGTLASNTGVDTFIEAVKLMRQSNEDWISSIQFNITGMGDALSRLSALSKDSVAPPELFVHGRVSHSEYRSILESCDVGLALKPVGGALADTTFPSKVVEYASAGLLVLTTDISDVRLLFENDAKFLESNDPYELLAQFKEIVLNTRASSNCALRGERRIRSICGPQEAGTALKEFLFADVDL